MTNPFSTDAFRIVFRWTALASVVYGLYYGIFDCTNGYSAFSSLSGVPQWLVSAILIVGGSIQFTGCCYYSRWWAIGGTAMCTVVFVMADISSLLSHPSTGIPAYFWIDLAEFSMIYCALRKPLPCPSK